MRSTYLQLAALDLAMVSSPVSEKASGSELKTPNASVGIPLCGMLALFIWLGTTPVAQAQQGQWSDLNALKAGQGIDVIELNMKSHGGEFVGITDEVITLREKNANVSIKRENVARISTASGARRGEHAVVGLVAGALIGAGIGAAAGSNTGFLGGSSRGITALIGLSVGGPIGAGIGACVPAHTTIYRAAPHAVSR